MLWCHAHSASTASDARGARARQRTDRLEVGRRQRGDALLRSTDAWGNEDGAIGRVYGNDCEHPSRALLGTVSTIERSGSWACVSNDQYHQPRSGRIGRQHGWPGSRQRSSRTSDSSRARAAPLFGWTENRERFWGIDFVLARGSATRRAHDRRGGHGSWWQAAARERACHVLRAADLGRQSSCRSGTPQSSTAAFEQRRQQASASTALLLRSQWATICRCRSAHESASEAAEETLIVSALRDGASVDHAPTSCRHDRGRR